MGGVHVFAGDVLSVLGAPAAGDVIMDADNGPPPPIERTAGELASISMALVVEDRILNLPERDFTRDEGAADFVLPVLPVNVPTVRNVPAVPPGGGGMSFRILPGDKTVTSTVESIPDDGITNRDSHGLRVINNVRVDEIHIEDVSFPGGSNFMRNSSITITGMEVSANALISFRR